MHFGPFSSTSTVLLDRPHIFTEKHTDYYLLLTCLLVLSPPLKTFSQETEGQLNYQMELVSYPSPQEVLNFIIAQLAAVLLQVLVLMHFGPFYSTGTTSHSYREAHGSLFIDYLFAASPFSTVFADTDALWHIIYYLLIESLCIAPLFQQACKAM
jgi:hypothetical protein